MVDLWIYDLLAKSGLFGNVSERTVFKIQVHLYIVFLSSLGSFVMISHMKLIHTSHIIFIFEYI